MKASLLLSFLSGSHREHERQCHQRLVDGDEDWMNLPASHPSLRCLLPLECNPLLYCLFLIILSRLASLVRSSPRARGSGRLDRGGG